MQLIANSPGCARSDSMSRPASYCRSIARSMSASARSASRSSPETGTANVSPGASMRAFAAMASIRASRSFALTCRPFIDSDNSEANTHRLPAAYLAFSMPESSDRSPAAAGEEPSGDRAGGERQPGSWGGCGRSALAGLMCARHYPHLCRPHYCNPAGRGSPVPRTRTASAQHSALTGNRATTASRPAWAPLHPRAGRTEASCWWPDPAPERVRLHLASRE